MRTATLAIFLAAYVLVCVRRLPLLPVGRTFGALCGAVLLVVVGCTSPREALASIDLGTLATLVGMMILRGELDGSGLLDAAIARLAARRVRARTLLALVVVGSGALSALLLNDAVCLMLAPLVARLCLRGGLPPVPFLLAVAVGSNVGGIATPVGTPQCMLIERFSGLGYLGFARVLAPVAAVLLGLTAAALDVGFRRRLSGLRVEPVPAGTPLDVGRARAFLVALGATLAASLSGLSLPFAALGGACLVAVLRRTEPADALAAVDGRLLLLFASLFVLVGALAHAGWVADATRAVAPWLGSDPAAHPVRFAAFSVAASNVFSNVPFVLVLGEGHAGASSAFWLQLATTSTLAGNLTLLGSVANLIVVEAARREGVEIGFGAYLRVGVPITLLTTAAGLGLLALLGYA